MKKRLLLSVLLATSVVAMAQNVGIGTSSPTDQLHTTGIVRLQNYSGSSDRVLLVDSAGRLKTGGSGTIFRSDATNSNLTIPDNGCSNGIFAISYINVSGITASLNTKIAVKVNITHSYVGDLALFLVNPSGFTMTLTSVTSGNSGDNFRNTIFTDGGTTFPGSSSAAAPFSGVYAPQGLGGSCAGSYNPTITNFASNTILNGGWALVVYDKAAGDIGTLDNWQITFDGEQALQQETNLGGNFTITSGIAAPGKVLTATDATGHAEWRIPVSKYTAFSARLGSNYSVTAGTSQVIPFGVPFSSSSYSSTAFDENNTFINFYNKYVVPADGIYQFNVGISTNGTYTASQFGLYIVRILINGQALPGGLEKEYQISAGEKIPLATDFSSLLLLNKDDEVSIGIFNNTGTTATLNSTSCYFSGVRIN